MKITKRVILVGLAVFIAATAVLTAFKKPIPEVIESVGEIQVFESEERLSEDMTPIVVDEKSPFYEKFQATDRVNILMLGVNQGMTDTIMLVSYDMANQYINIISIPRDTFVPRTTDPTAYAYNKINSIYHSKGVSVLAEYVSGLLYGMPIHYYVIVEYEDIKKVMDAIGGVKIEIPFYMKYQDTTPGQELYVDIPAGEQLIDSSNVIPFLRFRHTNPSYAAQGYKSYRDGDIGRIKVQQGFVIAVMKECLKAGNILEVTKVCLENVESDITYGTAIKVGTKALKGLSSESINAYTLPGTDAMINELSFWKGNENGIFDMLAEIYAIGTGTEADITVPTTIRLVEIPKPYVEIPDGEQINIKFDSNGNVSEEKKSETEEKSAQ